MAGGEFGLDHKTSMQIAAAVPAAFGVIQLIIGNVFLPLRSPALVSREDDPNWFWLGIAVWLGMAAFIYLSAA
jgi:hypothetical protein